MFRRLIVLAALLPVLSAPGRCQDSQSLGDLARQLRSQKSGAQLKPVITNDDLPSTSAISILGLEKPGDPANSVKPGQNGSPLARLAEWESFVKKMDSMDHATLLKLVLQDAKADFLGRSSWEERLFAAKQTYVSQGLDLVQKARQLAASAQTLQSVHAKADDPQAKELANNLKNLVRDSYRADAAFQAVVLEGRDLAHQTSAH